jgi:hypothetical protein
MRSRCGRGTHWHVPSEPEWLGPGCAQAEPVREKRSRRGGSALLQQPAAGVVPAAGVTVNFKLNVTVTVVSSMAGPGPWRIKKIAAQSDILLSCL